MSGAGVLFATCCGCVACSRKCAKQVRAFGGLIFGVLSRYDPEKLLSAQAQEEGLAQLFHPPRVAGCRRARA